LDNIYVELSNYHCLNSVEDMVKSHGADRFLFGTFMPFQDPGQAIAQLAYAEVSRGGQGEDRRRESGWADSRRLSYRMDLKEKGWRGLPLDDVLVIDSHCHYIGPWISDIAEYVRKMDLVGVDKICMTFSPGDLGKVEKFGKAYPGRVLAYQWYDPPPLGEKASLGPWIDRHGFIGYKIHPDVGCPPNREGYDPLWEAADKKRAAVLCHTWYPSLFCDPAMFMEVAERYPSAQIILGHSGGNLDGMIRSVEAAKRYDNIYMSWIMRRTTIRRWSTW